MVTTGYSEYGHDMFIQHHVSIAEALPAIHVLLLSSRAQLVFDGAGFCHIEMSTASMALAFVVVFEYLLAPFIGAHGRPLVTLALLLVARL